MKKLRFLQRLSGVVAIVAGICEIVYQLCQIKILHILFIVGLILYMVLFATYFSMNSKK